MSTLADLGVPEEEVNCGRLEAGSPRGTVAWTPLQYACALGDEKLALELLKRNPDAVHDVGSTRYAYSPLHVAVKFEHEAIVKLLLTASPQAKVNATDNEVGCTPLHLAILQGNLAITKLLLEDTNVQQIGSKTGTAPIELAEELERSDMKTLLLDQATRSSGRAQLAGWLASIGLVQYAAQFFDEGFDDPQFLLGLGRLDDRTLDAMHVQKAGHRAKLQSLYQLKEFLHVESENDENPQESDQDGSGKESDEEESESEDEDDDSWSEEDS